MHCEHFRKTMVFQLLSALCLLHGVTSVTPLPQSVQDSSIIESKDLDSILGDQSNTTLDLQDFNDTGVFAGNDLSNVNITSPFRNVDVKGGVKNASTTEQGDTQEQKTVSHKEASQAQTRDGRRRSRSNRTPSPPLPVQRDVNASKHPNDDAAGKLNHLRTQRQYRRLHRLQLLKQELPRRISELRRPTITEEMRQQALVVIAQTTGFQQPRTDGVETHQCYRAACALPSGTTESLWSAFNPHALRLFYALPKLNRRAKAQSVESARLKLFVKPRYDCTCSEEDDESQYLLVTVYQFLRPLSYRKKSRVVYRRKALSEMKVPKPGNVFVALDITAAAKTWMAKSRRNFGLEVWVKDANGTVLQARDVFGLPECHANLERSCRDDNGEGIEYLQWYGTRRRPYETNPYMDVTVFSQSEDNFDKYTLHSAQKRSHRHLTSDDLRSNPDLRTGSNIAMMLSRKLMLKRQKARRLVELHNRFSSLRGDPTGRHPLDLTQTLLRPVDASLSSPPSPPPKPHPCHCRRRLPPILNDPIPTPPTTTSTTTTTTTTTTARTSSASTTTAKHVAGPRGAANAARTTSKEGAENGGGSKSHAEHVASPEGNASDSTIDSSASNSQARHPTATSPVTQTTDLEWNEILNKLIRHKPLCRATREPASISDAKGDSSWTQSVTYCPSVCRVCRGKLCVKQTCNPKAVVRKDGAIEIKCRC